VGAINALGYEAKNLIGRSCHFNQLTVVHSGLFRPIQARLPPILPPALPPIGLTPP